MRDQAGGLVVHDLRFDNGPGAPQRVMVLVPAGLTAGERLPLLIALHGRGEANRGPEVGARAWLDDYELDRTVARLRHPPLEPEALQGSALPEYLQRLNARLAEHPFQGLVIACPYTPDIVRAPLRAAEPFGRFLVDVLIPRLRRELPVLPVRSATGIDGVSLGGRAALLVGMLQPQAFAAVGTLQAAFRDHEVTEVTDLARRMLALEPMPPRLRLLTSTDDPFRPAIEQLSGTLGAAGWPGELAVVPGRHDYAFNRGPGGIEMLLWHDRMLRQRG